MANNVPFFGITTIEASMIRSHFIPYFTLVFFFSSSLIAMDVAVSPDVAAHIEALKTNELIIDIMGKEPSQRIALLKAVLEKHKNNDFEVATSKKSTPLQAAVLCNQLDTAEILLQAGAKPEPQAFTFAAIKGRTNFIELFIKYGADINRADQYGRTPASHAVAKRRAPFLKKLLNAGARVDISAPNELSLLSAAATEGDCAIGILLLDAGADPKLRDIEDKSALDYAALDGKISFVELLLNRGVDIRATNAQGANVAHLAAYKGKMKMLQFIQQRFPESIAAEDYLGRTPLLWAAGEERLDIVTYLLNQGVPYDTTLVNGGKMLDFMQKIPQTQKAYELIIKTIAANSKIPKPKALKKKKKKNKTGKKTYNQRMEAQEPRQQTDIQNDNNNEKNEISKNDVPSKNQSSQLGATELNSLLGQCDDGSRVLSTNERFIIFGYKHLGDLQTDMIYRLRKNCADSGQRILYDNRVLNKRKLFLKGARDEDTVLHTQPEALERMSGHAIVTHYRDKKERTITNWVLFGKKRIEADWVEGAYVLGFTRIGGEITCYHAFFKPQPFAQSLQEIALTVTASDRDIFEQILAQVCPGAD